MTAASSSGHGPPDVERIDRRRLAWLDRDDPDDRALIAGLVAGCSDDDVDGRELGLDDRDDRDPRAPRRR